MKPLICVGLNSDSNGTVPFVVNFTSVNKELGNLYTLAFT